MYLFKHYTQIIKYYLKSCSIDNSLEEEYLINFLMDKILNKNYTNKYIKYLYKHLSNYERQIFISIVLENPIDIFCPWYKYIIDEARKSKDVSLAFTANSIYNLYQKSFDKINKTSGNY